MPLAPACACARGTALAMSAGVPAAWAQTADATLRGKAAANTDVVARNIATGVTRRTKSSADGSYTLPGLQPGTHTVMGGPGTEIDEGLTITMIENFRSGLIWRIMRRSPYLRHGLERAGFRGGWLDTSG
jgi:hypothetical protein